MNILSPSYRQSRVNEAFRTIGIVSEKEAEILNLDLTAKDIAKIRIRLKDFDQETVDTVLSYL
jgi:hypothetical protein